MAGWRRTRSFHLQTSEFRIQIGTLNTHTRVYCSRQHYKIRVEIAAGREKERLAGAKTGGGMVSTHEGHTSAVGAAPQKHQLMYAFDFHHGGEINGPDSLKN